MAKTNVLVELESIGAVLLNRHFVYKSGKHGSGYINLDPLLPHVELVARICSELVAPFAGEIDTVAAPAVGGIELSVLAALAANRSALSATGAECDRPSGEIGDAASRVRAVWADKTGDDFRFERSGFREQLAGKRVLVVEDLLTTGGSVMKVSAAAKNLGATIVGVSAICNRGGVTAEQLGVKRLETLADVSFEAFDAEACPLCRDQVPIVVDIGHGAKFRQDNPDYPGGYVMLLER